MTALCKSANRDSMLRWMTLGIQLRINKLADIKIEVSERIVKILGGCDPAEGFVV